MRQTETITVLGPPGCGKGTQSPGIINQEPKTSEYLSTGVIYRGAKTPDGIYGRFYPQIKKYIYGVDHNGKLLTNKVIVPIVGEVIQEKVEQGISRFVFDGFPRNVRQLTFFDWMLEKYNLESKFIFYELSDEIALQRIAIRLQSCKDNHQKTRDDDEPEAAKKRLIIYHEKTEPMIKKLDKQKRLITIDASGTIEEIAEITQRKLA